MPLDEVSVVQGLKRLPNCVGRKRSIPLLAAEEVPLRNLFFLNRLQRLVPHPQLMNFWICNI